MFVVRSKFGFGAFVGLGFINFTTITEILSPLFLAYAFFIKDLAP